MFTSERPTVVGAGVAICLAIRSSSPGPLFKFSNGQPFTKSKFTQHVQDALQALGLSHSELADHSFSYSTGTSWNGGFNCLH